MKKKQTCIITMLAAIVITMLLSTSAYAAKSKVKLNITKKTMYMDSTIKLKASTKQKVTWKSSDKKVATVDKKGNVHAVNKGKAVIIATVTGSKSKAKCVVTVKAAKVKVTLNTKEKTMYVKDKVKLKAKVTAKTGISKNVKWVSDNIKVAKVDSKGNVKALSAGIATIRAVSLANNKEYASCTLTVNIDDTENVNAFTISRTSFISAPTTMKTYKQLLEVMETIQGDKDGEVYKYISGVLQKYDEEFFEKNQLIVASYTHPSSEEIRYGKAERISDKKGGYILHITMTDLEEHFDYTATPCSRFVFIECTKSVAKTISRIKIDYEKGIIPASNN